MNADKKTVYIIGAGASTDWGFPVGEALKTEIAKLFEQNRGAFTDPSLKQRYSNLIRMQKTIEAASLKKEAQTIRAAMPLSFSIDNFLDATPDNVQRISLGKIAIVRTILSYERESELCLGKGRSIVDILQTKSWHTNLFQSLVENCTFDGFKERLKRVTFIVFNYDRVLEQFLLLATRLYYQASEDDAAEAVNVLEIIHPYGQCGVLPWQNVGNNCELDYGSNESLNHDELKDLAEQIYTFTDKRSLASTTRSKAHVAILNSERLVSLGFAFHPMNMQWLDCREAYDRDTTDPEVRELRKKRKMYACAYGMSENDLSIIRNMCLRAFDFHLTKVTLKERAMFSDRDAKCGDFMGQFSLSVGYGELV